MNLTYKNFGEFVRSGNPLSITFFRILTDGIILILLFSLFISELSAPYAIISILGITLSLISAIISFFLVRQGRVEIGITTLYSTHLAALLIVNFAFDGIGFFLMIFGLTVTASSIISSVKQNVGARGIILSVVVGLINILVDNNLDNASYRMVPGAAFAPWMTIISILSISILIYAIYRQFSNFTLRTKFILAFVIISALSLSTLGFLNSQSVSSVLRDEAQEALYASASQSSDSLQDFLNGNRDSIRTEARLPILVNYLNTPLVERPRSGVETQARTTLNTLRGKDLEYISSYALLDLEGNVLLDTLAQNIGANEADQQYFISVVETEEAYISQLIASGTSNNGFIFFSAPVESISGQLLGVLRVRYNADILQNMLERSAGLIGEDSFGVLFDENLIHIAHGSAPETIFTTVVPLDQETYQTLLAEGRLPSNLSQEEIFLDLPELAENLNIAFISPDHEIYFTATDEATGDRINQVVAIHLHNPNWVLAFFQPEDIFLNQVTEFTDNTILLSILSAIFAAAAGAVISQYLSAPILSLSNAVGEFAEGNMDVQAEKTNEDEIGNLVDSFNSMTTQLQNLVLNLENEVNIRTKDLEDRATFTLSAAEIARDFSREAQIEDLFNQAVLLINDRFELYHVAIYRNDSRNQFTHYVAGSGFEGEQLLETEERSAINLDSYVGSVAYNGQGIISSEVSEDFPISFHPVLSATKSEMLLPLRVGDQILGVLDLRSTNPSYFDEQNQTIFQTLADQIATSIQKGELRNEVEQALGELKTAYGIYTRDAWRKFVQTSSGISGYRFRQLAVDTIETTPPVVLESWLSGEVIDKQGIENQENAFLAVPLKIRGEVIGVLNLEFENSIVPQDTSQLVQEIANRLSLVMENARLVETSQQQVDRERLINEISNKIKESLDIDFVIRTATQEIATALDLPEVEIHLGQGLSNPPASQPSNGNEANASSQHNSED